MYIHVCIYICVYVYNEIINASAQQEVAVIQIAYCDVLECVFGNTHLEYFECVLQKHPSRAHRTPE